MIDKKDFRNALGRFATGITVVTVAKPDGGIHGMTANSFASVSLDPPQILVCVADKAHMHALIHGAGRFGVNILRDSQQSLSDRFARPTPDHTELHFLHTLRGTPLLEGVLATLDCKVVAAHVSGDHTIFIGEVEELSWTDGEPVIFYQGKYRTLQA